MLTSFAICNHTAAGIFVKHFWQLEGNPDYQVECILPKGEVELIFSFGDAIGFERTGAGEGVTPRCFVNGMSSIPVRLYMPLQQYFFGVVLQPAAVKKLLSTPSGLFLNAITDLELVDKSFGILWHQLADSKSFEERTNTIEQWVIRRVSAIHQQENELSQFLGSANGVSTVTDLAASVCYSTRQLHRKVWELYGMPTEVLLRYKRYRQALHLVHQSNETLTRIAYDCGYYDQAHFNREFKEYTNLTPGAYRRNKSQLPGHLYQ